MPVDGRAVSLTLVTFFGSLPGAADCVWPDTASSPELACFLVAAAWAVGRAEPETAWPEAVEADPGELCAELDGELPDPPA